MYAILDIETTGGQFNEEGITEIAIYRFDGHEIVDQFISLVNPEIPIQPFVVKLTGINNAMLKSAPKFHEVAKRIVEITQDCVLVAHNASFDFRILRTEFRRLGYDFRVQTLCTVELAQKLLLSTGNITTVIQNLEKRDLVCRQRSTNDQRYMQVSITDSGRALIASIFPSHVQGIVDIMNALTPEEQQTLAQLSRKLGLGK